MRCSCGPTAGQDVTCVQIAGLIARRILCYVDAGAQVKRGQRYGFIRFGSRVDVYLDPACKPRVAVGDVVARHRDDPGRVPLTAAPQAGPCSTTTRNARR